MRLLWLDIGKKRVGVALTDPLQIIASPYSIITYTNEKELIAKIINIIKEKNVSKIIVGLPTNQQSQTQIDFTKKITSKLQTKINPSCSIIFQDESFTSKESQVILNQYQKKKISQKYLDDLAASIILKRYLDKNYNPSWQKNN